jgi:hypothetical protein
MGTNFSGKFSSGDREEPSALQFDSIKKEAHSHGCSPEE